MTLDDRIPLAEQAVAAAVAALAAARAELAAARLEEITPLITKLSPGLRAALSASSLCPSRENWEEAYYLGLAKRQDASDGHPGARWVPSKLGRRVRDALRAAVIAANDASLSTNVPTPPN